jgi:hypothetical protein
VDVATQVGPRILGLSLVGGENVLAETPEIVLRDHGTNCRLYGGHRLWEAPEVPSRTWVAEDGPVDLDVGARSVTVTGPVLRNEVRKRLIVEIEELGGVVVRHQLVNVGDHSVAVALWALSMLRPGGTAVLPFDLTPTDPAAVQASATRIVLWPYTDLTDPAIDWREDAVVVDTSASSRDESFKNKLGCASPARWCAYILDGVALVKRSAHHESPIDGGATQQLYWDRPSDTRPTECLTRTRGVTKHSDDAGVQRVLSCCSMMR